MRGLFDMLKDDAERQIMQAWREWCGLNVPSEKSPDGNDALRFYLSLESTQSPLLNFRCAGDRWQVVQGWIVKRQ